MSGLFRDLSSPPRARGVHLAVLAAFVLSTAGCLWDRSGLANAEPFTESTGAGTGGKGSGGSVSRSGGSGGNGRGGAGGAAGGAGGESSLIGGGSPGRPSSERETGSDVDAATLTTADAGADTSLPLDSNVAGDNDASPLLGDAGAASGDFDAAPDVVARPKIIVRANGITANIVRAKIVFAQTLDAYEADIEQLQRSATESRWQEGLGGKHITEQEIVADEIYVKDLFCRRIVADQVFVQKATIERR